MLNAQRAAASHYTADQWSVYCLPWCDHITTSSTKPNALVWPSVKRKPNYAPVIFAV